MSVTCRVNKPTVRGSLERRAGRTVGCLRVATFTGRTQVQRGFLLAWHAGACPNKHCLSLFVQSLSSYERLALPALA